MTHCGFNGFVIHGFSVDVAGRNNVNVLRIGKLVDFSRTCRCVRALCTSPAVTAGLDNVHTLLVSSRGVRLLLGCCDVSRCARFCRRGFAGLPGVVRKRGALSRVGFRGWISWTLVFCSIREVYDVDYGPVAGESRKRTSCVFYGLFMEGVWIGALNFVDGGPFLYAREVWLPLL